jgi:trypsin-like peptidase
MLRIQWICGLIGWISASLFSPLHAQSHSSQSTAAIAAAALPSTVTILALGDRGDTLGIGSGFVVRPGIILTNWHVVKNASAALVFVDPDSASLSTQLIAGDETRDVAALRVRGLSARPLATTTLVPTVGERVVAIGSPLGLSRTVTEGIVSAVRRVGSKRMIQVAVPVSPGSSGGPVLNAHGRVFGLVTSGIMSGQALNFVTPVEYALELLKTPTQSRSFPGRERPAPQPRPAPSPAMARGDAEGDNLGGLFNPPPAQPTRASLAGRYRLKARQRVGTGPWREVTAWSYAELHLAQQGGWMWGLEQPVTMVDSLETRGDGTVRLRIAGISYEGYQADTGFVLTANQNAGGTIRQLQLRALALRSIRLGCIGTFTVEGSTTASEHGREPADTLNWSGHAVLAPRLELLNLAVWLTDGQGEAITGYQSAKRNPYSTTFALSDSVEISGLTTALGYCGIGYRYADKELDLRLRLRLRRDQREYEGDLNLRFVPDQ